MLNEERAIEHELGAIFTEKGATLATAESCTGGLIAHRLTSAPGASNYFLGGIIAYSNAAKESVLDVPALLIEAHGAVSAPVSEAMAQGARKRFGAAYGIGVTGIAGPGGGTAEKPVGLVYMAASGPEGGRCVSDVFEGGRMDIEMKSAERALELLRELLT